MDTVTRAISEADLTSDDEAALVEAARCDPAAFAALYRRYLAPIYRYLVHRLGNVKDAEDLTSQVFVEALEGLARYRDRGRFAAWLFTIARRKAITAYRRRRPILPLDPADETVDAGTLAATGSAGDLLERVEMSEDRQRMAALFTGLQEDQRELLRLRFTAGLSYHEIGQLLGRSPAAVKMAIYRLVRQMAERWEES
jgi:RNA polymerase sigma-70 factor (ECF subfamily)